MAISKEMTSGRPLPQILSFTLPLLLGNLLQQTYSLVDAVIVGKFLGINALASVGASTSVVFLILGFCNGCCGGFGIPVAQKFGALDYGVMRQLVFVSLRLATVMSLSIALGLPSETMSTTLIWLLAFLGGTLAGAIWGAIPVLFKALLNINEVLACIMTNWIAANLVTWLFDISNFKNVTESTKTGYIYKTTYNGVATAKMGLDKLFPNSQVNGGILIAIVFAIAVYVMMSKTTFGYQLKACGSNRHAARYAGIADKRNIVISMAIAGGLSAAGASLYYLSGNTEFFWSTYQSLPAIGFNGIPVAMLASCNPIGIIFTALFMSMLDISGLQLTNLTAYNEYITNVIIAVIVYLSAFSLVIKMWIGKLGKKKDDGADANAEPAPAAASAPAGAQAETEKGGDAK